MRVVPGIAAFRICMIVVLSESRRAVFTELDAADDKNREGNAGPIRDDLAADLRAWIADKLAALQAEARQTGEPIPSRLPAEAKQFAVPKELVKILNRDLKLAGISKVDDRRGAHDRRARPGARPSARC